MKKVLFVCYGGGHVRMVVPVARALRDAGVADVQVLGLTTAAPVVADAGLPLLQVRQFVEPADAPAVARGEALVRAMGTVTDAAESAAYLGLCHQELVDDLGEEEAARRYARDGRQAFLPVRMMRRILERVGPDLVVATNSPRGERAAILAAGALGIPSVCMVDLFALDEVRWIGQPGYARSVCVLNESVRDFLVAAGRSPSDVAVTGNPAFDALLDPALARQGHALRSSRQWDGKRVVLWPTQVEPPLHPFDGRAGDPGLPQRALAQVAEWALGQPDVVLCVRARQGEPWPSLPDHPRVVRTGQDWPLPPLLHAVDLVATLTSTVALEGRLAGCRVVQVRGSVFDDAMPLLRFGLADAQVDVDGLGTALQHWSRMPRQAPIHGGMATPEVLRVIRRFL
jgi:hypothetical protein